MVGRRAVLTVFAVAAVLVGLAPALPATAATTVPIRSVTMVSDSGDYLGNGVARRWSAGNATITVSASSAGLTVKARGDQRRRVHDRLRSGQRGAADDRHLRQCAGPAQRRGRPSTRSGAGRGCSCSFGRFVVHDFDVSGSTVNGLWIDYEIHCEYGPLATDGGSLQRAG